MVSMACLQLNCASALKTEDPVITFTQLPPFGAGRGDKVDPIAGVVTGARPGQHIVLYAKGGLWWVQPVFDRPYTSILENSTWKGDTHPGSAYAALLVEDGFRPPATTDVLPQKGGRVLAVVTTGTPEEAPAAGKTVQFSGYDWRVRKGGDMGGGSWNDYDTRNAWTDRNGSLHLCIKGTPGHWTSTDISLTRSLGYGSYRFVVRGVSGMEPAAVFNMLVRDEEVPTREMDIEISRWGQPGIPDGQFVIQPYFVPANTVRFQTPPGTVTFELRWTPGRALFSVFRGAYSVTQAKAVSHSFSSGVSPAGHDVIDIKFYVFSNESYPLQHATEVIVDKFEYLP
jgi:hypothetical protein